MTSRLTRQYLLQEFVVIQIMDNMRPNSKFDVSAISDKLLVPAERSNTPYKLSSHSRYWSVRFRFASNHSTNLARPSLIGVDGL